MTRGRRGNKAEFPPRSCRGELSQKAHYTRKLFQIIRIYALTLTFTVSQVAVFSPCVENMIKNTNAESLRREKALCLNFAVNLYLLEYK